MTPIFTPGILGIAAFQRIRYLIVWPFLTVCFGAWLARSSRFENWEQHLYSRAIFVYATVAVLTLALLMLIAKRGRRLAAALLLSALTMYLGYSAYPWQGHMPGAQSQPDTGNQP